MLRAPPSPDPKVSVEFLDRQFARDNLYVQYKLGRMLLTGRFYPQDLRHGYEISSALADRGYRLACLFLALDFYSGTHGLPQRMDLWQHYWRKWRSSPMTKRVQRERPAVVIPFRSKLPIQGG